MSVFPSGGASVGPTPRESFLLDFATYTRFFLAVPLLLIAETVVGPRLTQAGLQFVRSGFARQEDYPIFERAIARVARRRESVLATLVLVSLCVVGAWTFTAETTLGASELSWTALNPTGESPFPISLTCLWNRLVAVPIVQFMLYRWLWRILNWTLFLWDVARMNLELVPTHADEAGGLGFLGTAHTSFAIFAFGLSSVYSAEAGFRIVFENAQIDTFKVPLAVMIVATQVLFLGPLLVFMPVLARNRRAWLKDYSAFVVRYNREFHKKWIEGPAPVDEPLLGSGDIQSLADLGNSFRFIKDMKFVPFSRRAVLQLAVATALPGLPLLLLVMPIGTILDSMAGVVF